MIFANVKDGFNSSSGVFSMTLLTQCYLMTERMVFGGLANPDSVNFSVSLGVCESYDCLDVDIIKPADV